MTKPIQKEELVILNGQIKLPYKWTVGETGSYFLMKLRDQAQIWGTKCPKCNKVYIPPRKTCGNCFADIDKWEEVGPQGTLQTFTVIHYKEEALHVMEPPFAYGIILLDGADTGLIHYLGEIDLAKLKSGMRFQAVFKEQREGSLLDIKYFRPID